MEGGARLLAAALLASTLVAALHDVSQAWDSVYYHLPFAARIAGIVPPERYTFSPENQARFAGFPLLGEALCGLLWRVFGTPSAANLLAWGSVPAFAWFLRRFGVPFAWSVVSLFAIPLVLTHATSAYVDLPGNTAAAALLLLAMEAWDTRRPPPIFVPLLLATFAANVKFQLAPFVVLGLVLVALRTPRRAWIVVVALPLVFASMTKNVLVHGNPVWPIELRLPFGVHLPFAERAYASVPRGFEHMPHALLWIRSIFDVGARPLGDPLRFTVDQYTPPDEPAFRMGGFFGPLVAAHLALLAFRLLRRERGVARGPGCPRPTRAAALFALLSVVAAVVPQSHELRYYMLWMLVLVGTNLRFAAGRRSPWVLALSVASVLTVAISTDAVWLLPGGSTFKESVAKHAPDSDIARIPEGGRVCVDASRWTFFYAAPFHPPRRYSLREAGGDGACGGDPKL